MAQMDRYEILSQLGRGAMGIVYRARDTALDREIALKTIRTGADVDPQIRERFYREARACARLQHPNIIAVYDLGECGDAAFIAMELLVGSDFREIIRARQPLSLQQKIQAFSQVCDAVSHAHKHGVIHRDIKPSNLFLTEAGYAKVLDFGIARLPSSRLTVAGQILGTPNYMAPEQLLGQRTDGRADIFSLCVVLFELLTYAHPFESQVIPRRIVHEEPDSLFDYDSSLPVVLERVVSRGLSKDPEKRYATCDELTADLRAIQDVLNRSPVSVALKVDLPSARPPEAAPVAAPAPLPITQREDEPAIDVAAWQPPSGEDSDDWRLSEALRLLPDFESAVERRDTVRARSVVRELEGRLAGDIRFLEALRLCRSRFAEIGGGLPKVEPPPRIETEARAAVSTPRYAGTAPVVSEPQPMGGEQPAWRSDAGDLTDILGSEPIGHSRAPRVDVPTPPRPPSNEQRRAPSLPSPVSDGPGEWPERTTLFAETSKPPAWSTLLRNPRVLIAAGAVVCLVSLLVIALVALRPVPQEPAIATAAVEPVTATIVSDPDPSSKTIATVERGTRLNVLSLPGVPEEEWTRVQCVSPKIRRPGYIRTSALESWVDAGGAAADAVRRSASSGESMSDRAVESEIRRMGEVVSRFRGSAAGKEARLQIARLRLTLGERFKTAGRLPDEWKGQLRAARQVLQPLRQDGAFGETASQLDARITAAEAN